MPHIEKAHPAGVISKSYLADRLPTVLLKTETPKPGKTL